MPEFGDARPISDYEGFDYRAEFWHAEDRRYEDAVERVALRRFLPGRGRVLLDVGAGFGRLADEYNGFDRVILLDHSLSLLDQARARFERDPRFVFVAGNWYSMPFGSGSIDTVVHVRALHHAVDVARLLGEIGRVMSPGGVFVLEFANKRNLKAMLRYASRRQPWSPYAHDPIEYARLHFNFHPTWILERLRLAGFAPERVAAVSHHRWRPLKAMVPTDLLVAMDALIHRPASMYPVAPSVFVLSTRQALAPAPADTAEALRCPVCASPLETQPGAVACVSTSCRRMWRAEGTYFDFRTAV